MRVLLAIASCVAAILTALFAVATVFALVSFGAIIWWQPLSVIVFGGIRAVSCSREADD
ncbi:hypothetical protein GOOTI_241_00040 [Gordonia otitidis NBRC 100426]|uniref:Uncharacterized protein n=1 Tax=Gordonia otitidis (strain DSM 44809 / CCUG 52243 / JCM 12355 / NBRC 100426 / IFM 10032) TaxID=1108044 RepID=H5TTP1_GORO1|nr:hypothetical protein GOOTI_241_00040 [Gordonia otitidis NBRC 100426]